MNKRALFLIFASALLSVGLSQAGLIVQSGSVVYVADEGGGEDPGGGDPGGGGSDAFLHWSEVEGATGYRVYWDSDGGPDYRYYANVGNVTEIDPGDIEGLVDGTWTFAVCAIDDQGFCGQLSAEVKDVVVSGHDTACDTTISPGTSIGTTISNASPGAYICLNSGNYSGFTLNNVQKNPRVTVRALTSANITGTVNLTGSTQGVTIDLGGGTLSTVNVTGSGVQNVTFRQFDQKGVITVGGPNGATPNIVFEDFTQTNANTSSFGDWAFIADIPPSRSTPVVTIRNATIDGGCSDGVRVATPLILEDSRIMNKQVGSCPNDPHTDAVQFYGGPFSGSIIRRNYFYCNVQVLAAYDGVDGVLVENNLFDPGPSGCGARRPDQIEWYDDDSSIIRYNTVVYRTSSYGHIALSSKSGGGVGKNTQVYDNIANSIALSGGSTASVNTNNCVRAGSSPNVVETPTYAGGEFPETFAEALLTTGGCVGKASDGGNPGIRFRNLPAPSNFGHN